MEAIVETEHPDMNAEPSQGSHFFHNITTLGINYLTISKAAGDHCDWPWLAQQDRVSETEQVAMVRLIAPLVLKVDGKQGHTAAYVDS